MTLETAKKKNQINDLSLLAGILAVIILLNLVNQKLFFRLDLTSEKRYTLSDQSKEILKNLDDFIYVRLYLDGELKRGMYLSLIFTLLILSLYIFYIIILRGNIYSLLLRLCCIIAIEINNECGNLSTTTTSFNILRLTKPILQ